MADFNDDTAEYGAWLPKPTPEQERAELIAQERLQSSVPVIQDVLDWFNTQIATYKNPLTIEGVNPATNAETVKTAVLFAQTLISDYKRQREQFIGQFKEHIKEKADEA